MNDININGFYCYSKIKLIIYLIKKIHFLESLIDINSNITQGEIDKAHEIAQEKIHEKFPNLDSSEIN